MPQVPVVPPIPATLPTKQYPHLRTLIHELDFRCASCSSAYGVPAWRTFLEADKDPISGPGKGTTVFLLKCPECHTVPTDGPYIGNGIIDLLAVPHNYKRPPRPSLTSPQSLSMDHEDDASVEEQTRRDAEALRTRKPLGGKTKKKDSDLNPKSKKARNEAKASTGGDGPPPLKTRKQ
jgi:hypothetical protein